MILWPTLSLFPSATPFRLMALTHSINTYIIEACFNEHRGQLSIVK